MSSLDGTSWHLDGNDEVTAEFGDGGVFGSAGCNSYRAAVNVDGAALSIGPAITTMMACEPERMAIERDVLTRWATVRSFVLGDTLVLFDQHGEVALTFVPVDRSALAGRWDVVAVHRPERQAVHSVEAGRAHVVFEDDRVSGNAGCNRFTASCTTEGTTLSIGAAATTRMACDEDSMTLERAVLAALDATVRFRLVGSSLTLLRSDGGIALALLRASS
jgi:heat shock protein HslJ